MRHGHTSLFHGGGRQGGKADDVARGVDVGNRGLEVLIDLDPATLCGLDADALQTQFFDVAPATDADQSHIVGPGRSILELQLHLLAMRTDAREATLHLDLDANGAQLIDQASDDLTVDEGHHVVMFFEQCYAHVERRENAGVLDADGAGAHDHQRARNPLYVQHGVRIMDQPLVKRNLLRAVWRRPRGDQDEVPP